MLHKSSCFKEPFIQFDIAAQKAEESPRFRRPIPDEEWSEIISSMKSTLSGMEQVKVRSLAKLIAERILWLDVPMSRYCDLTCPSCLDACCLGNEVFYNQADILYLLSAGGDIPPGQTRALAGEPCRYLSEMGCRIPRLSRPYVCVWFICEPQMGIFHEERTAYQRQIISVMQEIRACRLRLESLYELHEQNP